MKKALASLYFLLLVVICISQNSTSDSLKLYYKFENIFGSMIFDESGNGNVGYRYNAYSYFDRFGRADHALRFNGNSSFVFFDANSLTFDEYSYCAWVSITETPSYGTAGFIIDLGSFYGVDQYIAYTNQYSLYTLDGALAQGYNTDESSSWISRNELFPMGVWKFIVYTRSNDFIKLYIDGELFDSLSINNVTPNYGDYPKGYIGCRNTMEQYFHGVIDDVRIYNIAISSDMVVKLYTEAIVDIGDNIYNEAVIYPNPSSDFINISMPIKLEYLKVEILNSWGVPVKSFINKTRINVMDLTVGLYLLIITNMEDQSIRTYKVVKL